MEKWFLNRSGCWEFFSLSPIFKAAATSPPHLNNTNGEGSFSCSQPENGYSELDSISSSQLLQHPIQGLDHEHHTDFSEAMTTVEKALRRVAQEKASAQAEASEWKRKYQLEKAKKSSPGHDIVSNKEAESELPGEREAAYLNHESDVAVDGAIANGECCRENGICNHEILRDGEVDCKSGLVNGKLKAKRKASFKLAWDSQDENSNQYKHEVISFARGDIVATGRSSKQISLEWETSPQTVLVLTKPNSDPVQILCAEMIRWLTQARNLNIFVEPRVRYELLEKSDYFDFVQTWKDEEEISLLHKKVDLLVTLGGDGTVLWAASLFKGPIPPIVPFALGSLGFMTTFNSKTYKESLDSILRGPFSITLRHRLQCCVVRCTSKDRYGTREKTLVLNEVTIDRGISSFLTNLECYCDDSFMTRVQGDGLILSTTSGSTAYSLAAGGSMVHPQVPGILFTPISPHSLSFRPLILPEYVTLKVQVPEDSRSSAWVSFDGKGRKELKPGDALLCSMAPWPLPTACQVDSTKDFLRSIHEGLHWNLRKTQSSDGPRDPQVPRSLENGS